MRLKDLISQVSAETSIPEAQVRTVARSILTALRDKIEESEDFTSPFLNVKAITTKPVEKYGPTGEKITIPERKIGRVVPKKTEAV